MNKNKKSAFKRKTQSRPRLSERSSQSVTKDIPRRKLDLSQLWLKVILCWTLDINVTAVNTTGWGQQSDSCAAACRAVSWFMSSADWRELMEQERTKEFLWPCRHQWSFNNAAAVETMVWKHINRSMTNFTPFLFNYFNVIKKIQTYFYYYCWLFLVFLVSLDNILIIHV